MRAPINEYYTDKEYEFALKEMRRIMERKRALAEAQAAQKAREKVKKEFEMAQKISTNAAPLHEDTHYFLPLFCYYLNFKFEFQMAWWSIKKAPNLIVIIMSFE